VCSSSLAICAALGLTDKLTKGAVAEFTCTAERYVGVTSGGMDQAISVMGMPGLALLVEFNPVRGGVRHVFVSVLAGVYGQALTCCMHTHHAQVRATDVQLPAGATFVVANSLTVSKKAETADRRCVLVRCCHLCCLS
jgi:N-acetylgalactosamine kinase